VRIAANAPVLAAQIASPCQRTTLSVLLPATTCGKAVNDGVAGFVPPGDRVDAVLTLSGDKIIGTTCWCRTHAFSPSIKHQRHQGQAPAGQGGRARSQHGRPPEARA
jgi:hypothetical protein